MIKSWYRLHGMMPCHMTHVDTRCHMLSHVATRCHTLTWEHGRIHGKSTGIKGERSHGATEPRHPALRLTKKNWRPILACFPGTSRGFPGLSRFGKWEMEWDMEWHMEAIQIASHHIPFDRTCERNVTLWHLHVATYDNDSQCTSVTISLLIPILLDLPKSA